MKTYSITLDGKEALHFKATLDDALLIYAAFKSSSLIPDRIGLKEIEES